MKRAKLAFLLAATSSASFAQTVRRTDTGIIVHPAQGPVVRLEVYGDGIIRVTEAPNDIPDLAPSLMVRAKPLANGFTLDNERSSPIVRLSTGKSSADVDIRTGSVSFRDGPGGKVVLAQTALPSFRPATAEGVPWLSISQQFNRGTDEGFYGLGQHQNGQMNYNGEDVILAQHNMDVAIPFVVSTRNYGLL
jgi:alpha-D-xyloside xylohydrolase